MRVRLLLAVLLLAGCLSGPNPTSLPQASFESQPRMAPIPAAAVASAPSNSSAMDPSRDLRLEAEGFQASRLVFRDSFTVRNVTPSTLPSRDSMFVWIVLVPTNPPTSACDAPTASAYYQWLGTPFGNLAGATVAPGDYTLLFFASSRQTVDLDLGETGLREPTSLPTEQPSFGLRVISAEPRQKTVSLTSRISFEAPFSVNGTGLFFSQFTVAANTFHGTQSLESELHHGENACGGTRLERSGSQPSGSWTVPLNRTLPAGELTWRGEFEARAAANPRGSAYGYLIEWPRA